MRFGNHLLPIVGTMLATSACTTLFPPSTPVRYYGLMPIPATAIGPCAVRFGVRPVALPGYVDRDEILIERRGTELVIANTELWAAPLRGELTRTLGESVALRWTGSRFVAHPWRFGDAPAWAIDAAFEQIDPGAESLQVRARWSISTVGAEREPAAPTSPSAQSSPPVAQSTPASAPSSRPMAQSTPDPFQSPRGEVAAGRFETKVTFATPSAGVTADAIAHAVAQLADRVATDGRAALAQREPACR